MITITITDRACNNVNKDNNIIYSTNELDCPSGVSANTGMQIKITLM